MHFDARKSDGPARSADEVARFAQRFLESGSIALESRGRRNLLVGRHRVDAIARQLDVNGPLLCHGRIEAAIDLAKRRQRVVETGGGNGNSLEDLELRRECADTVMQQQVFGALLDARRAADHDHGRLLGIGARHRIHETQAADGVRDADRADAVDPRIGVRRVAGVLLVARADDPDRTLFEHAVETQDEIAGDAKHVVDTERLHALDQVAADGVRPAAARRAPRLPARRWFTSGAGFGPRRHES